VNQTATIKFATHSFPRINLAMARGRMALLREIIGSLLELTPDQFKRVFLLALIILLAAPHPSACASVSDDLYHLFEVDLPSADIVILLDASRSMIDHQYADVRQAVIDFAPALTDKDNLHLRIFGETVSNPLEGNGDEVAHDIDQYLPREPSFTHTDLGLAILKGLEFLERDGASKVQVFFLLTDGLHQPPQDSPYSHDFADDPEWQALKQRAYALCRQHSTFVYGFGIGRHTDISVLRQIFPAINVEAITGSAAQVALTLRHIRERLSRAQLRQSIEQEINNGLVEVELAKTSFTADATSFDLPITIHNGYHRLPIKIEEIQLQRESYSSTEVLCELEGDWKDTALEPGQRWHGRIKGLLRTQAPPFHVGKARRSFQATFNFVPVVRFQDEAALDELGVDSIQPLAKTSSLTVDLHTSYGISYLSFASLILILATGLAIATTKLKRAKRGRDEIRQRYAERKCLAGTLKIWLAQRDEPEGYAFDLSEYQSGKLNLVIADGAALEITSEDMPFAEVVARLSGHLIGASSHDGESGKPEFHMEMAGGHSLAYQSSGQMVAAAGLVLSANDLIEIDDKWRLRYVNHRLRTRAEMESAQTGGDYHV
jgi:hypothetical protein